MGQMFNADDTTSSLEAAVALVNSASGDDALAAVADLEAYFRRHRYSGRFDRTDAELQRVRALRPRLRELLTSPRDDAVAIVNAMLAGANAVPQLVRHDGIDWHLHAIDFDAPLDERIVVETALAMVDLIRADELSRLGICAADDCTDLVLDMSRNRCKRFCSTRCSNRTAVAAYRARRLTS